MAHSAYTVFVDESFYKWFGLPSTESNFCYAALSVPTARLKALDRFEASLRNFVWGRLPSAEKSRIDFEEIKYTHLKLLSPGVIDEIGRRMATFLQEYDGTIFGFFIPASGYLAYMLRSDFIDDLDGLKQLPEKERHARLEARRQELLQKARDAEHNIGLLSEIYPPFFNMLLQHHGRFLHKTYRIVYDSRNPEEDKLLHQVAEDLGEKVDRLTPDTYRHYLGHETSASAKSPGLRLVDWFAGDIRAFFRLSAPVLSAGSSFDILSPYYNPEMILVEHGPYYKKQLPPAAMSCFETMGRGLMMPSIKPFFASGLISYYAEKGEARHVSIPHSLAFDMAD